MATGVEMGPVPGIGGAVVWPNIGSTVDCDSLESVSLHFPVTELTAAQQVVHHGASRTDYRSEAAASSTCQTAPPDGCTR
mmetsp:Transcript_63/g.205  ORF Transcript_63/g.205 Transcript_63/m.205 type:complete len:80 (-) Transcript_63:905-1144(-)|eukprot:scaffold5540_cov390-Prasinococcus_capsulatus_cf.AAC.12